MSSQNQPISSHFGLSWSLLNAPDNPVRKTITSEWRKLVDTKNREQVYHKFLSEHAGFFFNEIIQDTVVVSKMKFGANFVSDFVVCYDRGSNGFEYELIEIERPDIPLYTKNNKPTAHLVHAIQQILDWKAWLLTNSGSIKNIFPSSHLEFDNFLNLRFTIIIGTRKLCSDYEIKQRNLLSKQLGITIRSFDYLTDKVSKSMFADEVSFGCENKYITDMQSQEFSNPFYHAYTDQQWRRMITTKRFSTFHMVAGNMATLLSQRQYNQDRIKQFAKFCSAKKNY